MESEAGGLAGATVSIVGHLGTETCIDIFTLIDGLDLYDLALASSDPTARGVLELSVGSLHTSLHSTLDKIKEYGSSHHLEVRVVEKTLTELRGLLEPHPRYRIIFSSASSDQSTSAFRNIEDLRRETKLRVRGAQRRGGIVAIDVESDVDQLKLQEMITKDLVPSSVTIIPAGVDLRRPRAFVFIGGVTDSSLIQQLHMRGCLVLTSEAISSEGAHHALLPLPGQNEFQNLLMEKGFDPSESVVILTDSSKEIPSWIPRCIVFSTSAVSSTSLVLDQIPQILDLVSATPYDHPSSIETSQVLPIDDFMSLLAQSSGSVSVECSQYHAHMSTVSAATTSDQPEDYVLTTTSNSQGQRLLSRCLTVLNQFAVSLHHGRLLSAQIYSPLPPTADAATLLPLDSFDIHVALESKLDASTLVDLRQRLKLAADELQGTAALQLNNTPRIFRRLAVFDMDSTLVQQECIDEMAEIAGVGNQVKNITLRAMNGELDFEAALRARVALLEGLHAEDLFQRICRNLEYTPGASLMAASLQRLKLTLAVVSGGFTSIISTVKDFLGLHHAHANELEISNAKLTGNLVPGSPIVDSKAKLYHLNRLSRLQHITEEQAIAVGDGANDLLMIGAAGLGVAFVAKPHVQKQAQFHINHVDLTPLLFLLGISRQDAISLLRK